MKRIKYTIEVEDVPAFTSEDPTKILYYGTAVEDYDRSHEEAIDCVEIADTIRHRDSSKTPLAELAHFVAGRLEELKSLGNAYEQLQSFYEYLESTPLIEDEPVEAEYEEAEYEEVPEGIDEKEYEDNMEVSSIPTDDEEDLEVDNIVERFTIYSIPFTALKPEVQDDYIYEETILAPGTDIEDFSMAELVEFDEEGFYDFLHSLFDYNDFAGYIAFSYNTNWQNQEGYKTSESLSDILNYDYEVNIDLVKVINDYAVEFRVSSHDVPTGASLYVIGIPDEETYQNLVEYASFEEVKAYVEEVAEINVVDIDEDYFEEEEEYTDFVPEEEY